MRLRATASIVVGAFAACSFSPALAELVYTAEAGMGYSDNITRVPSREIDETVAVAGVDLKWTLNRPQLTADVDLNLDYFDYLDNTYDREVVGTADGLLLFNLVSDRLTWLVQDSFGQARDDPFAPVTPDNRENVNYFTTGPDLLLRMGRTGVARVFGRYSFSEYERSALDGDRLVGGLAIGRRPTTSSEISLNAVTEQVRFEDDFNTDFDRNSAYLSYSLDGNRNSIAIDAGFSWLEPEVGEKTDGALLRVALTRNLSPASSLSLTFGTQLTDTSDQLRSSLSLGGAPLAGSSGVVASADTYENRYAGLGWSLARNRTSLNLSVNWTENAYETQTQFDRSSLIWYASAERRISRTLTAELGVTLSEEEFDNNGLDADELRYGAALNWQFGRNFGLRLLAERFDRDSTEPDGRFVENRAFVTLFFRPQRGGRL